MVSIQEQISDVDKLTNKMLKASDDLDKGRITPEIANAKARVASVAFTGIGLRRKLVVDARSAEIDVTPKKQKTLESQVKRLAASVDRLLGEKAKKAA